MSNTLDLSQYGITDASEIIHNPSFDVLFEEETRDDLTGYEKGTITNLGAVAVDTGIFTGRSPKDKYIVMDDVSRDTVWWSTQGKNDNKPLSEENWGNLKKIVTKQLSGQRLFVVDTLVSTTKGVNNE